MGSQQASSQLGGTLKCVNPNSFNKQTTKSGRKGEGRGRETAPRLTLENLATQLWYVDLFESIV